MQILVLVDQISPRVKYIITQILGNILDFDVLFTLSTDDLSSFQGPNIAYTKCKVKDTINITPISLLSLKGIFEQSFAFFNWNSLPAFFLTDQDAEIPFDLFAASFFLISRYEEYLPHEPDTHGRFRAEDSIAFKNDFLDIPIVDIWALKLGQIIQGRFPGVEIKARDFKFSPTIDIDNAYAYRHKGLLRSFLGTSKDIVHFRLDEVIRRIAVYSHLKPDPFDTYETLYNVLSMYPEAIWFILGGQQGRFDRGLPIGTKLMRKLLGNIADHHTIGIHPSYGSGTNLSRVSEELNQLKEITGIEIIHSRQHFLKIKLPETYRLLAELGIQADFSMGYSKAIGFRAGTCTPFNFYDLIDEKELPLKVVPFQVMDRALLEGLKLDAEKAITKTLELAARVREVGGTFVTVWHNESLSGINEWKGWENVFADIVSGMEG